MSLQEDLLWLRNLEKGDDNAYALLYEKYYSLLCSFAYNYVEDDDIAQDIVQEIFIKFYKEAPEIKAISALKSYLYLMTKNHCLNYLKHLKIEKEYVSSLQEKEKTVFFFNQIVQQELYQLMVDALNDLPEQTSEVFKLILEGYDNPEIAEKLNLSMDSVKSHKKRGKQFLKGRLNELNNILLAFL